MPLFLDFVGLLVVRVRTEQMTDMQGLAPYVSPGLRQELQAAAEVMGLTEVEDVIVGAVAPVDLELEGDTVAVQVRVETNYTEYSSAGRQDLYTVETWTLSRKRGVLSQGPEEITRFACPSCGSPSELRPDGTCPYCDKVVNNGSFAWLLTRIDVHTRTPQPPLRLGGGGQEVGTDRPTVMQPDFEIRRREFGVRHPDFSWPAFAERVSHIFLQLQQAWMTQKWELARPFETDSLFATHRYWMEMYRRKGLENRLEDIQIEHVVPVKIDTDAYFESITVRLWASMKDYTVEKATGKVMSGNPRQPRRFSEYWTFIRRSGVTGRKTRDDPKVCPNCGAPLQINMAGVCEYCGSKITSGEFDWVLSRIDQDEVYGG
jgi:predicted lipid-binding transport protein (Tim44 family)